MSQNRNFLDADEGHLEKSFKFVRNEVEDELNQLFTGTSAPNAECQLNTSAPPRDYKVVTPKPGFCIKSFKVNSNEKYFINVCQTDEIPAPEDISEEELTEILQSETPSNFRIPMSISEPRTTKDKSNNPVDACDIAINCKFFLKCQKSILFKDFFLALIAEALSDKYNVQIKIDKAIILNNRKFIGTLVSHRVRNNDIKTVLNSYSNPSEADKQQLKLLNSLSTADKGSSMKPLIQEVNNAELKKLKQKSDQQSSAKIPEFKMRAKVNDDRVDEIQAEFYLPDCISSQEIVLDIGEDRIFLESTKRGYLFDKFVEYHLNQERARAIFDKTNKMLQLRVPVYPI